MVVVDLFLIKVKGKFGYGFMLYEIIDVVVVVLVIVMNL